MTFQISGSTSLEPHIQGRSVCRGRRPGEGTPGNGNSAQSDTWLPPRPLVHVTSGHSSKWLGLQGCMALTEAYGGLYSRYLRWPFSLGLKSESSEKSEKSSLEEAWRCG